MQNLFGHLHLCHHLWHLHPHPHSCASATPATTTRSSTTTTPPSSYASPALKAPPATSPEPQCFRSSSTEGISASPIPLATCESARTTARSPPSSPNHRDVQAARPHLTRCVARSSAASTAARAAPNTHTTTTTTQSSESACSACSQYRRACGCCCSCLAARPSQSS